MYLQDVIFLAADTARSKAYGHAMQMSGIRVSRVCILRKNPVGSSTDSAELKSDIVNSIGEIQLPDLSKTLDDICAGVTDDIDIIECQGIKSYLVEKHLLDYKPKLIIYSGFGGEIVPSKILDIAPFLHMHAGWLPKYRGSTTIYYSLLEELSCGVSAILLDPEIDKGPIVGRKKYPPPPIGIDIDYVYDNAIRANLLVSVLQDWNGQKSFIDIEVQSDEDSTNYYVIHPVLKHLVMLGIDNGRIA